MFFWNGKRKNKILYIPRTAISHTPHILRYACMYGVIEIPFSKRLVCRPPPPGLFQTEADEGFGRGGDGDAGIMVDVVATVDG